MEKRFKILAPIALIVVIGLILAPIQIKGNIPYLDNFAHFTVFGVLTYIFSKLMPLHRAVVWCIILALLTEFAQHFIPNRSASIGDLLSNYFGVAVVTIFYSPKNRS